jgi:hypothetical protein
MAQFILGGIGAVVGFYFGGPSGAMMGFSIGYGLGGLLFPEHHDGPNPADVKLQNSAYGLAIPWNYSMFRQSGNVIWISPPTKHSEDQGGKGGPTVTTYSYSVSCAIALCEGPIQGIRRIWANGKLIYDVSNPSNFPQIAGSANMVNNFTVYYGDESQLPDPVIESYEGAGNVSAFRGLAYVVFKDFDLSPYGSYIPQFSFEVVTGVPQYMGSVNSASFNYPTAYSSIFECPYITAESAVSFGFGYFLGYQGILVSKLTAYGNVEQGFVQGAPTTPQDTGDWYGISDIPGFICRTNDPFALANLVAGWFDNNNGTSELPSPIYGIPAWNGALQRPQYIVDRNDVFTIATAFNTNPGGTIYKGSIDNLYYSARSSQPGEWRLIGCTASYLYALDIGWNGSTPAIHRFNRADMSYAGLFAYMPAGWQAQPDPAWPGCVADDQTVYICNQFAQQVWRVTPTGYSLHLDYGTTPPFGLVSMQNFVRINDNLFAFTNGSSGSSQNLYWLHRTLGIGSQTVSNIIDDMCTRAGLQPTQWDSTSCTDLCYGYGVTNHSSLRSDLGPLQSAYFFDVADSEGKLKFVRRGKAPVGTIPWSDLGVSSSEKDEYAQNPIQTTRLDEHELSKSYAMTYFGLNNDYNDNTQNAFRSATTSNKQSTLRAPIVLADNDALVRTQAMLWSEWIQRESFQFSTSLQYLIYEPSDVVYLQHADGSLSTVRLTKCAFDGMDQLKWDAVMEEPSIYPNAAYSAQGGSADGQPGQQIDYSGPTILRVLDSPPLRDLDSSAGLYVAACGPVDSWNGAVVSVSRNNGGTYTVFDTVTKPTVMGVCTTVLGGYSGGNFPDEGNTVTVQLYSGTLASVNNTDFYNEVNTAMIGGEIVCFRDVIPQGGNVYLLRGLIRGRQGTEWAIGTHGPREPFTFLNPNSILREALSVSDFGTTMLHRAQTTSIIPTAPGDPVSTTVGVACIKPFAPVLFGAFPGAGAGTGGAHDTLLRWTRRARVNNAWNNGYDVPLDESSESYTVQVMTSGGVVKRTAVVTGATTFLYTQAMASADGFSVGNTVKFSVAQNSDQGVLGYAATVSSTIP